MTALSHGGRLDAAIAQHGGSRGKWMDLSTGINPHSYPIPELARGVWHDLPDDALWNSAATALRRALDVDEQAGLSFAAGSQQHIAALPRLVKTQDVAVVGFTYGEHAHQWRRAGHTVTITDGLESAEATARVVVLVNPNNPDGRLYAPQTVVDLSRRLAQKGGLLVVDEAFAEVTADHSVAAEAGREGLVVLRSFGKFYGLAGLRLGAALTSPAMAERLDEELGPWAASGPALGIAAVAYGDRAWRTRMVRRLAGEMEELQTVLADHRMKPVGATSLFALVSHPRAAEVPRGLAERHILVRSFERKPDWLRFGLPDGKVGMRRLASALGEIGV